MSQVLNIPIKTTEYPKDEAMMKWSTHLATIRDDNGDEYCSMAISDVVSFKFKDKTYHMSLADLFNAVEGVHNPESLVSATAGLDTE